MTSDLAESPPPGASVNVQQPETSSTAEMEHAPLSQQHTERPELGSPAHPEVHMHPDLDFALPDIFSFIAPFRPDGYDQGFAAPIGDPIQRGPTGQAALLSPGLSHANFNGLPPAWARDDPPPSRPLDTTLADATGGVEPSLFGMGTGQMFDIGTLGSISSGSVIPRTVPHDYSQAPSPDRLVTVDTRLGEYGHDGTGTPDFMPTDDTLATWPSLLPIFGWVTWSLSALRFEAYASLIHLAGGMVGTGGSQMPMVERRGF